MRASGRSPTSAPSTGTRCSHPASRRCSGSTRPSGPGMPWSNSIMSCWIMPSHFGSGVAAGAQRVLSFPGDPALSHVRAAPSRACFLVVPEDEPDRSSGLHIWTAEHARQFHHERRPRAIVIRRFAVPAAIHVRADDVHRPGAYRQPWCEYLFARTWRGRLQLS